MRQAPPGLSPALVVGLVVWLVGAIAVSASGLLAAIPPPFPQLVLLGLTTLVLALVGQLRPLRRFARTVDLRVLVAFHLTRFVGLYFLVLHARGELPYAFAVPYGWGDTAIAVVAVALLCLVRPTGPSGRGAYLAWNLIGAADILFVVATAGRLAMADPGSMQAITRLPLALLPTFVVPLIIATHVVMLSRLVRGRATPSDPDFLEA